MSHSDEISPGDQQRLYDDLVWLFPIISPPEDYISETGQFIRQIREHAPIPVNTLLDLGCGAGHNDHAFLQDFQVTGVDASPAMLSLARRLNPEVEYLEGDLRTARLDRQFDAVIIADSIDYMLSEDDLNAAFESAFYHLRPGGVFCTYAEETLEKFTQNGTYVSTHVKDDIEVALIENHYDPDPADTTFEMTFVYLIRRGGALSIETDCHRVGIFPLSTWVRLLGAAGFDVRQGEFEGEGFPFFVGVKPL
jgi:SAM-dependent methyltransferase